MKIYSFVETTYISQYQDANLNGENIDCSGQGIYYWSFHSLHQNRKIPFAAYTIYNC